MAGLCIIARQSSKELQPWRCLNLAVATCRDSNRKQVILTPGGAVVPVPLHNQFGLRSAMITYNNRPLMGRSAEMDFGDSWTGTSETSDEFTRLIEYLHPSILPAGTADRKLPGLAFGQSYDFLAGIVRSSGALPELFAAKGNPGQLLLNNDPSKTEFTKMYIDYHQTVQYLRTVPVSELRFGRFDVANPDDSGSNKALGLPIIPAGVLPRAFEYPQAKKDAAPTEGTEKESPQPVVLLTDYTGSDGLGVSQFQFNVFKPTVDLRTWDAWEANDPTKIALRKNIWHDYHTLANHGSDTGRNVDLSLDDPAVSELSVKVE